MRPFTEDKLSEIQPFVGELTDIASVKAMYYMHHPFRRARPNVMHDARRVDPRRQYVYHWSLDTVSRLTSEQNLHDVREMWTIMNKDRFMLVRREIHRGHPTAYCVIFNNLGITWDT